MDAIATAPLMTADAFAAALADPRHTWPCRDWALLDVREHGAFERGHIPGATSLPRRRLEFRMEELVPARTTPVLLYDDGGDDRRAWLAADDLRSFGYTRVSVLDGGLDGWRALGGVPATGVNVPCKAFGERVLAEDGVRHLDAAALDARRAAGARIAVWDVRTAEEFVDAHIPAACSAPGFELALRLADLEADCDTVVVNCAGRTRSIIGTATLALLGARAVFALENGTMGWRLAGRALAHGEAPTAPPSPTSCEHAAARAEALARDAGVSLLPPAELAALLAHPSAGARILDVRTKEAFAAGHIAGAAFTPGGQAVQRADDFIAVPGADMVFVDDGDARALLAAYWYRRMGFPRVHVLAGGMPAWRASSRSEENGRPRPAPLGFAAARAATAFIDAAILAGRLEAPPQARPVVVDVGSSRELMASHLPGALWLPRGSLEVLAPGLPQGRAVVLASAEPAQSILAARTLARLGFAQVQVLDGGVPAWRAAGLPVAEGLPEGAAADDVVEPPYRRGLAGMRAYLDWEIALHGHVGAPEPQA
ncbi:rhodanese-like domain-containing protein [Xanthobacter pseudotagetidis]|uniref:rhodanese-like domain-containing protein n=1 Tax=Xanthobacter pseudotagetidis TaxID=3119911 RepID=UPI00372BD171